jgi:hypothetical protein
MVYFSDIKISVPINTYIWYILEDIVNLCVVRNNKLKQLYLISDNVETKISMSIDTKTKYMVKDNIVFCVPNLMMIEWLTHNDIILTNSLYLQFCNNPYFKPKHSYLFVGLLNISNHPTVIQDILKPYESRIYNPRMFMELFTVLNINLSKSTNIDIHKSIDKLIICDSNENELSLNWVN